MPGLLSDQFIIELQAVKTSWAASSSRGPNRTLMLTVSNRSFKVCYSGREGSGQEHHPDLRRHWRYRPSGRDADRGLRYGDEACTRTAKVNLEVPPFIPCDGPTGFLRQTHLVNYRTKHAHSWQPSCQFRDVDFARSFNRDDFGLRHGIGAA